MSCEGHVEAVGCDEYLQLSRRQFMGVAGSAAVLAAAAAPAWLPRVAFAKDYRSTQRDIVISIYLRGASDGLSICTPFTDPNYYAARPNIALAQPDSAATSKLLSLGSGGTVNNAPSVGGTTSFGMNPALAPLFDVGLIDRVVRPLMSGKEAQVYLVVSHGELRVAKVFKEAHVRSFKNRAEYTEGRKTRNSLR